MTTISGSNSTIPIGSFATQTLTYSSGNSVPSGNLTIVLSSTGTQSDFDNVRLSGNSVSYYVEDLLGTSRVMTTATGVVCYDADFYPYGGERTPYTNTCTQNNYKFEGKERDSETGNDDFGARYYSNRFGRWLSADWSSVPEPVPYANLTNPQTLNLYAMVTDDPESFADLDGHDPDVNFQNQNLEDMFNRIAAESPSFSAELDAAKADHNIQVTVNEVGVQKLPDHAPGDAVVTLNADGSIKVIINVKRDDERTSEHELGHEKDARTNTEQFRADGKHDAKVKGGPGEKPHDERPIEQRANKFRDQVEKERKQHRQEQKEQKRREKEERKKKKANENQPS